MTYAIQRGSSIARKLQRFVKAALLAFALGLSSGRSAGQSVIDDADPERSVPSPADAMKNPMAMAELVMELASRAEQAQKRGDFAQAALYYRALAKSAPDRAFALGRACWAHDQAGQRDKALEACRGALGRAGVTVADAALFVQIMLKTEAPPGPAELEEIDAVVDHVEKEIATTDDGRITASDLRCQVAVRLEDLERLVACTEAMNRLAPKAPQTFVYASTLALKQGDWNKARKIIERAREAGLPSAAIGFMEETLAKREQQEPGLFGQRTAGTWLIGIAAASLLIAFAWLLRRRAERQAQRQPA